MYNLDRYSTAELKQRWHALCQEIREAEEDKRNAEDEADAIEDEMTERGVDIYA